MHKTIRVARITILSFAIASGVHGAEFHGLGDLPGGKTASRVRNGISHDGRVVVGSASSHPRDNFTEAFRWTPETGMVGLGFLPDTQHSQATNVSPDGSTIIGLTSSDGFFWTESNGFTRLTNPEGPHFLLTPQAISSEGDIVGLARSETGVNQQAFLWNERDGVRTLPVPSWLPPRGIYRAIDVSTNGYAILGVSDSSGHNATEGFIWNTLGGYTRMQSFSSGSIQPRAIADDEATVVGGGGGHATWWRADVGAVDVGAGQGSHFHDISKDGRVAVGQGGPYGARYPLIWDEFRGSRNLVDVLATAGLETELEGWKLEFAFGVSGDGTTIIGNGINPDGNNEAWRAVLDESTPTPSIGDANLDNRVDFADFVRLSAHFGQPGFWYQGDFDQNYRIDTRDFELLTDAFGMQAIAVPEPTVNALGLFALLGLAKRRASRGGAGGC